MADPNLVTSFIAITNTSRPIAEQYLQRNHSDITAAIEDFYRTNGDPRSGQNSESEAETRTSRPKKARQGGIRTLRDLGGDDAEDDDRTDTNFFTGGEKSALQVENPDKNKNKKKSGMSLVDRIFQRANEQMGEEDDRPSAQADESASTFSGTGFRLGDSTSASEVIEDRQRPRVQRPPKVNREITFWKQGFTVGEGPLRRYDNPENEMFLQELKKGRVPVSLLDVEFGQDVDVSIVRKEDEDYVPPKRKISGFHGQGQRLGSPVPGEDLTPSESADKAVSPSISETPVSKPASNGVGDALVQIRFANGKRVSRKFNSSDPIPVVYDFVRTHEYNDASKSFILSHAFPVKAIEESESNTVESEKLKNAVIIQRWA